MTSGHKQNARLFVGGTEGMKDYDLKKLFGRFGRIDELSLGPTFAFVQFVDPGDAEVAARKMNGALVDGVKLKVEHARPKRADITTSRSASSRGGFRGSRGRSSGRGNIGRGSVRRPSDTYDDFGRGGGGGFSGGDQYSSHDVPPLLPRYDRSRSPIGRASYPESSYRGRQSFDYGGDRYPDTDRNGFRDGYRSGEYTSAPRNPPFSNDRRGGADYSYPTQGRGYERDNYTRERYQEEAPRSYDYQSRPRPRSLTPPPPYEGTVGGRYGDASARKAPYYDRPRQNLGGSMSTNMSRMPEDRRLGGSDRRPITDGRRPVTSDRYSTRGFGATTSRKPLMDQRVGRGRPRI